MPSIHVPTLGQIQSIHRSMLEAASRFASYNYRSHFIRRTNEQFLPILSSLQSHAPHESPEALSRFYQRQVKDLEVLKRAAEVNRMFEGPKLVVEHARPITSGGGAGMEASAGGGGQPV
ncbi:putative mitochondrion protein [Naematelia encephala]|uniref:Putative mitochondrion protein n=1 Tax=Naematelia encephala TaxID=71784 RepID=A0A1Y2AYZ0_9TREE|nr:putative mitochondrion protein [Naematelia encephala]